ncbi:MAG: DNA repair protein RecO [Candidatus Saccharimonadales bacterium]
MSVLRTRAIVLRRTNYGEADRIIQFLTPEGKRSVMVKSARREKSKLAGGVELFGVSDVVITTGRGDLGILTAARLVHFYRHIMEDYDRLQFGYEAIKQVTRASEMVDEPEWFDVLFETYKGLDVLTLPLQLTQVWFYLRHAELMGMSLNLRSDVDGRPLTADSKYTYDVAERGLRQSNNGDIGSEHIKLLRLIAVKSLETLVQVGGIASLLPECWSLARQHAAVE